MEATAERGNNPEQWNKLLESLDEKLQLGLLDRLRRIKAYHFEEEVLLIEPGSPEDETYLSKDSFKQQLQILAHDAIGIEKIKIKKPASQS